MNINKSYRNIWERMNFSNLLEWEFMLISNYHGYSLAQVSFSSFFNIEVNKYK